ncbi:MAG TPA: hypothetical protein VLH35_05955 [Candidatus Acidoferrales bacterium]|nr:hypothetical protein [Candidatus Acidoferrales bacterium]
MGNFQIGSASGTDIAGIITSDAIWTTADSPYTLTGALAVNTGVTLTIEPGVIVNLNDNYLQVNGTLTAKGTPTNPIQFNEGQIQFTNNSIGWNEETATGAIIEYAIINNTQSNIGSSKISIIQSSPKINYVNITCLNYPATGIAITNGSPTITNCNITTNGRCIEAVNGNITICDNALQTITYNGMEIYNCSNVLVSGNIIQGKRGYYNTFIGVGCVDSNASICNNTVSGFEVGIGSNRIENSNEIVNTYFTNNLVFQNQYGLSVVLAGLDANRSYNCIQNNTSFKNNVGLRIYRESNSTITAQYNNLFNNSEYEVRLQRSFNVDAGNNWWGTTNTTVIEQKIYDFHEDFSIGNVTYDPILTSPNTGAPTFTNASSSNHGAISPMGITRLNCGENQTFTITANSGYYVADVLVNGTSVGPYHTITIQNITAATTVYALFAPNPALTNPITAQFDSRYSGSATITTEKAHTSTVSIKLVMPPNASTASMAIALFPYNHSLYSVGTFSVYASYTNATPRFLIYIDKNNDGIANSILLSDYQGISNGSWHLTTGGTEWGWTEADTTLSWNNTWQSLDYWKDEYRNSTALYLGVALDYWSPDINNGFGLPVFVDELVLNGVTYNIAPPVTPTPTPTPEATATPTTSSSSNPSSSSSSSDPSHSSSASTSPTPTPTVPELSLIVLLPMLAAVLVAVIIKQKNVRRPAMRSF